MRRRLLGLAAFAALLAVLVPAVLSLSGTTAEARDRLVDLLVADPPISRDLAVVGVSDPRLWAEPPPSLDTPAADVDSDRLRFRTLVRTLEEVVARDPRLVVLTEVVTPEDLTEADGRALVEVLATGRVLMPYLDDVPVDSDRRSRSPLSVTAHLPLAHAVVEHVDPGDRLRTVAVTEEWEVDGERLTFVALPLAALSAVAAVPISRTGDAITAGDLTVPLETGRLRVNFSTRLVDRVPGTTRPGDERRNIPYVAAEQLAIAATTTDTADAADAGAGLAGRIVLVGTVDPAQARYVPVPGSPAAGVPELWVHANALNTLLVGAPQAPAAPLELLVWLTAVALGSTAVALRRPPAESALWLVPVGVVALVVVGVRGADGTIVDPVALLLTALLGWGGTFLARYVVEGRQRRRVAALFRRYVPDAVAEQLIEDEVSVADLAAGTRCEVTVVFCDLRGFTARAGALEPGRVRDLLNVYYRHTTGVVLDHGGTVMQYVGDEVFAVFGAPLPQSDHTDRAVAAALGMQAVATDIAAELAPLGVDPVSYGIGVHTGSVVAAHVGDAARTQYAVVGDTVNVGARLCAQAGPGEVVVSGDVLTRCTEPPDAVPLGAVPLKGVERDLPVLRIVAPDLTAPGQGSTRQDPEG